jgi:hypothetical protein
MLSRFVNALQNSAQFIDESIELVQFAGGDFFSLVVARKEIICRVMSHVGIARA